MKSRHIQVGLLFVGICLLIGLAIAFLTTRHSSADGGNTSTAVITNAATPVDVHPIAEASRAVEASPDFLVTEQLRRSKPKWEELGEGPTGTSFCKGDTARLTNGSARPLNLNLVVSESDASEPLGSVQAGQTLKFDPGDVGTWNIVDAGDGGPLFQYEVTACPASAAVSPAATLSSSDVSQKQGKCRLTVGGKSYIDGACYYSLEKGGSFEISDTADGSGYFAQLTKDDGSAEGYWNGDRGASHASEHLGILVRSGGCWKNAENEICLWG